MHAASAASTTKFIWSSRSVCTASRELFLGGGQHFGDDRRRDRSSPPASSLSRPSHFFSFAASPSLVPRERFEAVTEGEEAGSERGDPLLERGVVEGLAAVDERGRVAALGRADGDKVVQKVGFHGGMMTM